VFIEDVLGVLTGQGMKYVALSTAHIERALRALGTQPNALDDQFNLGGRTSWGLWGLGW
jgi:hypothetical protein